MALALPSASAFSTAGVMPGVSSVIPPGGVGFGSGFGLGLRAGCLRPVESVRLGDVRNFRTPSRSSRTFAAVLSLTRDPWRP